MTVLPFGSHCRRTNCESSKTLYVLVLYCMLHDDFLICYVLFLLQIGSLHNASLLIDDIEDSSKLRRGVPVAHSIYGVANTINCANYVYFLALEMCTSLQCPAAMHVFVQELLNLHRGQGLSLIHLLTYSVAHLQTLLHTFSPTIYRVRTHHPERTRHFVA